MRYVKRASENSFVRKTLTFIISFSFLSPLGAQAVNSNAASSLCPVLNTKTMEMKSEKFSNLDAMIQAGIGRSEKALYPGAVLYVIAGGKVVHQYAAGDASYLTTNTSGNVILAAKSQPMRVDTLFDLASVTKVVATTAAVMHLIEEGKLKPEDTLGELLPTFIGTDKAAITVKQLITHRSGLWEWQPLWLHLREDNDILPYLKELPLRYKTGEKWAYSDLNFILLGKIVEKVSGEKLNNYVSNKIYRHLDMIHTRYLPVRTENVASTSLGDRYQQGMAVSGKPYPIVQNPPPQPFDNYREYYLRGEANDANAWLAMKGVSGHAGVFSTAGDLARYVQTLLNKGCYGSWVLASPDIFSEFEKTPYDNNQAWGFRKYALPGANTPIYGHTGFTGTSIMFAPEKNIGVILLTNRLHRDESANENYPSLTQLQNDVMSHVLDIYTSDEARNR